MGVISGVGGAVNGVSCVMDWKIAYSGPAAPWAASCTAQGYGRLAGNADWRGIYHALGDNPVVFPTKALSFIGATSGTPGIAGDAMASRLRILWDMEQARPIEHWVEFGGNGALTLSGSALDATTPNPEAANAATCTFGEVRRMELIVLAKNPRYATNATTGFYKRVAGNVDAEFRIESLEGSSLPTPHSIASLNMGNWDLDWAIYDEVAGMEVDIHTPGIVTAICAGHWTGYKDDSQGFIKGPGGIKWPF